jgi:arsenate reductase
MFRKKKVLFLCLHNSDRTQMAEALMNHFYGNFYEAYSAGTDPMPVKKYTKKVMEEIGIDISRQYAKSFNKYKGQKFDYVVTVCDNLKAVCPYMPGGCACLHWPIKEPLEIYDSKEKTLKEFRKVRDEIRFQIGVVFGSAKRDASSHRAS